MNKDRPDQLDGSELEAPPKEQHYGYRPDAFPVRKYRWWGTEWAGQFDVITPGELDARIAAADRPVFDYEERGWD